MKISRLEREEADRRSPSRLRKVVRPFGRENQRLQFSGGLPHPLTLASDCRTQHATEVFITCTVRACSGELLLMNAVKRFAYSVLHASYSPVQAAQATDGQRADLWLTFSPRDL